ncbi:MAG TPA: hypothetical protein VEV16_07275 [Daejeonella sp.]|nr:hypothetical protein [Daejeonella sp.]
MLYLFTKQDSLSPLSAIPGLEVKENDDPLLMSILGQISLDEARNRLLNDHKAYVAYLDHIPVAFGWLALGKAKIGELDHEFIVPFNQAYLWNFRTLESFRGRGIYPHLLQGIIALEQSKTSCFWIMHAPENRASQRGILKAGFNFIGEVSVLANQVVFQSQNPAISSSFIMDIFGFNQSEESQASCWNCSSPYLSKRKMECCCSLNEQVCSQNLFALV